MAALSALQELLERLPALLGERLSPEEQTAASTHQNGGTSAAGSAATTPRAGGGASRTTTDSVAGSREDVPEGASLQPAPSDVEAVARVTMQDEAPQAPSPRALSEEAAQSEPRTQIAAPLVHPCSIRSYSQLTKVSARPG